jgi:predicted small integral membrane protein
VALSVAPYKKGIQNFASILVGFGKVTDLRTNFQKIYEAPICCANVDLDGILNGMSVERASSPLKYLVLPLSVRCL